MIDPGAVTDSYNTAAVKARNVDLDPKPCPGREEAQ